MKIHFLINHSELFSFEKYFIRIGKLYISIVVILLNISLWTFFTLNIYYHLLMLGYGLLLIICFRFKHDIWLILYLRKHVCAIQGHFKETVHLGSVQLTFGTIPSFFNFTHYFSLRFWLYILFLKKLGPFFAEFTMVYEFKRPDNRPNSAENGLSPLQEFLEASLYPIFCPLELICRLEISHDPSQIWWRMFVRCSFVTSLDQ